MANVRRMVPFVPPYQSADDYATRFGWGRRGAAAPVHGSDEDGVPGRPQRRPIFSRTSAIVAAAIGARRSAPASRIPSTSAGWAISSAYRSRAPA
jgi:hypothetical protein